MKGTETKGTRGFVLVNALVLVAALSVVALALLSRAEGGRVRMLAAGQAVQLELYLDAYEALARAVLNGDPGAVDHGREPWARADNNLPLDRGQVAGRMRDLQGMFNLNWLTNPEDEEMRDTFDRLLTRLGVAPSVGQTIIAALGPGGAKLAARRAKGVTEDPPGGAALMLDQLPIPEKALARLRPFVTVLPGDSQLNVNTTSALVLASFLPGANSASIDALLHTRKAEPFKSVGGFVGRLVGAVGAELAEELDQDRFSVGSDWFEAEISAGLEGRVAARRVVLQRLPLPAGAQVAYRLDTW